MTDETLTWALAVVHVARELRRSPKSTATRHQLDRLLAVHRDARENAAVLVVLNDALGSNMSEKAVRDARAVLAAANVSVPHV